EDVVIGYVGTVLSRLADFGITLELMDYPDSLKQYLGRKIWSTTIDAVSNQPDLWPVFVKSKQNKRVTGVVVQSTKDLIGCGCWDENPECYCSEVVDFLAEWRVFVRYGKILDVRPYTGDWRVHYDANVIESAVGAYTEAPNGYALDFGQTADGRTLLVEANDGYALGSYGLYYADYAKLLSARWAEMTNTDDYCDFMGERAQYREGESILT
ncbi:MAG: ATP-grasp domain-containing protein, partial [Peptococcaceae bacterium]|nr:ATP-grasp domain-containing protein [Peptococcaceae bacterium]